LLNLAAAAVGATVTLLYLPDMAALYVVSASLQARDVSGLQEIEGRGKHQSRQYWAALDTRSCVGYKSERPVARLMGCLVHCSYGLSPRYRHISTPKISISHSNNSGRKMV
jgi:hypothetical protein